MANFVKSPKMYKCIRLQHYVKPGLDLLLLLGLIRIIRGFLHCLHGCFFFLFFFLRNTV